MDVDTSKKTSDPAPAPVAFGFAPTTAFSVPENKTQMKVKPSNVIKSPKVCEPGYRLNSRGECKPIF
uniref:Uncharacterized protein n=1 Tax=Phlebotomus papatasi TaxID=29031 RepID=A0A1B0GMT8_PHLPP